MAAVAPGGPPTPASTGERCAGGHPLAPCRTCTRSPRCETGVTRDERGAGHGVRTKTTTGCRAWPRAAGSGRGENNRLWRRESKIDAVRCARARDFHRSPPLLLPSLRTPATSRWATSCASRCIGRHAPRAAWASRVGGLRLRARAGRAPARCGGDGLEGNGGTVSEGRDVDVGWRRRSRPNCLENGNTSCAPIFVEQICILNTGSVRGFE